ncbi:hypothetical protein [Paraburkholderia caballeronis]|uniref:hypothetical protein n=1 Tax=Paraburkholderia caballeronis TaxID=416943 RepID=UPI001FCB4BF3|nr:hypothetical protein [Paraburkholderia caballeronis]
MKTCTRSKAVAGSFASIAARMCFAAAVKSRALTLAEGVNLGDRTAEVQPGNDRFDGRPLLRVVRQASELITPFDQRVERPSDRAVGFQLPEGAHPLGLGRAFELVLLVVDVDTNLLLEKLTHRSVGEVEHEPAAHVEERFKAATIA